MARERLYLFDTTLRDGAQTNGVDFTLVDKLAISLASPFIFMPDTVDATKGCEIHAKYGSMTRAHK
jgi:hypothetical protein